MDQKSTIYTLDQFNHEVDQGHIYEVSVSGSLQLIRIVCTTVVSIRGTCCGTHLRDLWAVKINGEKRIKVGCGVCCFTGYRKIGKEHYVNGKYSE